MRNRFNCKDPDLLTPGQLVDLYRQRESYFHDMHLPQTMYMPFESEVQIPTPKQIDNLETKLASFYRYIEDQKEMDRRTKLNKRTNMSNPNISQHNESDLSLAHYETGMKGDGQIMGPQQAGLGYGKDEEDIYAQFRKQKSQAYYNNIEVQKYKK